MSESMNEKIAKLLRLAEGASTPEEADAASKAAERLMIKWSIDEAVIRAKMDGNGKPEKIITVDGPTFGPTLQKGRVAVAHAVVRGMGNMRCYLANDFTKKGSSILKIVGFESDVERAVMLINSITIQADRACVSYWRKSPLRGKVSNHEGMISKRSFLFGFARVIETRLVGMRNEEVKAAESSSPGTQLALLDRDQQVKEEYSKLSLRAGKKVRSSSADGMVSGSAAGRNADLGGNSIGGRKQIGGR